MDFLASSSDDEEDEAGAGGRAGNVEAKAAQEPSAKRIKTDASGMQAGTRVPTTSAQESGAALAAAVAADPATQEDNAADGVGQVPSAAATPQVSTVASGSGGSAVDAEQQQTAAPEVSTVTPTSTPAEVAVPTPASAATATPKVSLRTGMAVRLVGFSSEALNGARGRLGKYSESKNLWQVFMESSKAAKAVTPKNLEPITIIDIADSSKNREKKPLEDAPSWLQAAWAPAASDWRPGREEGGLPYDDDHVGWIELLRDAYLQQLREEHEIPEPPPFHTCFDHAADHPVPKDKLPRHSLQMQLHMLTRSKRGNEEQWGKGKGKGGMMGWDGFPFGADPMMQAAALLGGCRPRGPGPWGGKGGGWNFWPPFPFDFFGKGFMGKGGGKPRGKGFGMSMQGHTPRVVLPPGGAMSAAGAAAAPQTAPVSAPAPAPSAPAAGP